MQGNGPRSPIRETSMTEDQKYEQIVKSREVEPAGGENLQGGENKSDPQDDKAKEPSGSQSSSRQDGTGKATEPRKEPTPEEKQRHAIAEMRIKFKRENDSLRKEIETLKKAQAAKDVPAPKTRKDFETDGEYGDYLRKEMEDEIYRRVSERMRSEQDAVSERAALGEKLRQQLEGLEEGLSEKVFADISDQDSDLYQILTDERGEGRISELLEGPYGAEILAIIRGKPEIFRSILELPGRMQEFRLCSLVDSIERLRSDRAQNARAAESRRQAAESLPSAGTFGTNGNGVADIGGMSAAQRVAKYKAEMRKRGII